MKIVFTSILILTLFFGLPLHSSAVDLSRGQGLTINNGIAVESIGEVLNTELGNKMVGLVEDLGGSIENLDDGKSLILPNIEVSLIPAGQNKTNKLSLLYVDFKNNGKFLFAVESPLSIFDFNNANLRIYTPSGKIISFSNFRLKTEIAKVSFQKFDDINNSIHLTSSNTCTILLILGIFVLRLILIVWAIECL
jgi:hypothetical protein